LAFDGFEGVQQRQQLRNVMAIGSGQNDIERNALPLGEQMVFGTRFASVYWTWPCFFPAPTARTKEESTDARDQSNLCLACSFSKTTSNSLSHTPASCQSRKRRQQVIPLPQPNSRGKYSQGIPVLSTNKIPVNASRLPIRYRYPDLATRIAITARLLRR